MQRKSKSPLRAKRFSMSITHQRIIPIEERQEARHGSVTRNAVPQSRDEAGLSRNGCTATAGLSNCGANGRAWKARSLFERYGHGCVRFKSLEDLALDVVGRTARSRNRSELRACPWRSTWPITRRRGRSRRRLKYWSGPRCWRFWRWSRRERSADIRSDLGPASNAGRRQKRRNPSGARQTSRGRRRSLVTARCGDAPHSLLALRPSASTRDPLQDFNRLQGKGRNAGDGAAGLSRNGLRSQTAGLSKSSAKKGARKSAVKKAKPKK
jgi:hypothetical protein